MKYQTDGCCRSETDGCCRSGVTLPAPRVPGEFRNRDLTSNACDDRQSLDARDMSPVQLQPDEPRPYYEDEDQRIHVLL
jgi:hypothetical protein